MPERRVQLVRVAVSLLALAWLWAGSAGAQVPSSIAGFPVANFTLASKGPVPKHGANAKYDAMGYFGAGPQKGPGRPTAPKGLIRLGIGSNGTAQPNGGNATCDRDGYIFVPQSYQSNKSAAFLLALHDAGGNSSQPLQLLAAAANTSGTIILAPDSRGDTWDLTELQYFGPDIDFIDRALNLTFGLYNIDIFHLGVEGFSDGATYALSIGIINGDMFQQIMSFTPGGVAATSNPGSPFVYLSAGTQDSLFKSQYIINGIVPLLKNGYGLNVTVNSGPWNHTVPPSVAQAGMQWFQKCPPRLMAPSPSG